MTSNNLLSRTISPSGSTTDYLSVCLTPPELVHELTRSGLASDLSIRRPTDQVSSQMAFSGSRSTLRRVSGPQESVRLRVNSNADRAQNALWLSMIAIQLLDSSLQRRGQVLDQAAVAGFIRFLHHEAPRQAGKLDISPDNLLTALWTNDQHDRLELRFHDAQEVSYSIIRRMSGSESEPSISGTGRLDELQQVISAFGAENLFDADLAGWPLVSPDTQQLLARLDDLSGPDADHSLGAVPPDPQALQDARAFVLSLPNGLVHLPDIGLADDGEVNFLWKDAGIHVDLGFYGSGTFSYYARDDKGKEYLEDECRVAHGLPSDLIALLTR